MPRALDLSGQSFARLRVIRFSGKRRNGHRLWTCECECGTETLSTTGQLRGGHKLSCGCERIRVANAREFKHGHAKTPTWNIWMGIKHRCGNPNASAFKNYGGRGIKVCDRWLDFENFLSDMGVRPSTAHSIDRINNDGDYEPGNCRWATRAEQRRNSRCATRSITFHGETMLMADWAKRLGVDHMVLHNRLRTWSMEDALTLPLIKTAERPRDAEGHFIHHTLSE